MNASLLLLCLICLNFVYCDPIRVFLLLLWVVIVSCCIKFLKALYLFDYATSDVLQNEPCGVNLLFSSGNTQVFAIEAWKMT